MSSSQSAPPPAGAEHDALPAGTRFGEFEILRVLGVGGFGIVYLAMDHSLEREVALKEYMPASLAARGHGPQITVRSGSFAETYAVGLRSFINEARLLAKFDHPGMVKVYRFWEDNGTAYMVMPYLQGRTLRDARKAMAQPPDEAWIRNMLDPVLGAIERLHREEVYHRDIAPDNILLPPDGPPMLLDFGAARRVISDRTQSLTAILKPSYAPIEQYAEMVSLRQGPWTDIYAIGAVIHFLLFGVPPSPATARAVQDDLGGLAQRTIPGVSPRFMAAAAWALAVRPQQRPQNVAELRGALDGRIVPPVFDAPAAPTAATAATAATTFAPTLRVESAYSEPTQADLRRPVPSDDSTVVLPTSTRTAPATPSASPPPATRPSAATPARPAPAAAAAAAPSSGSGMVYGAIGGIVLLAAAAGWWVFGRGGDTPPAAATPALSAAPTNVSPPPAAATAAPTLPPVQTAAPVVAAPAMPPSTMPAAVPDTTSATNTSAPPAAATDVTPVPPPAAKPALAAAPRPRTDSAGALRPREPAATTTVAAPPPEAAPRPAASPPPAEPAVAAAPPPAAPTPAAQQPTGPSSAREVCGSRILIALALCMDRECKRPEFVSGPDCRKYLDDKRRRDVQRGVPG